MINEKQLDDDYADDRTKGTNRFFRYCEMEIIVSHSGIHTYVHTYIHTCIHTYLFHEAAASITTNSSSFQYLPTAR
jgi:hypothetical protein